MLITNYHVSTNAIFNLFEKKLKTSTSGYIQNLCENFSNRIKLNMNMFHDCLII